MSFLDTMAKIGNILHSGDGEGIPKLQQPEFLALYGDYRKATLVFSEPEKHPETVAELATKGIHCVYDAEVLWKAWDTAYDKKRDERWEAEAQVERDALP